jgi:hypothetical protein
MMEQQPTEDEVERVRLDVVGQNVRLTGFDAGLVLDEAGIDIRRPRLGRRDRPGHEAIA